MFPNHGISCTPQAAQANYIRDLKLAYGRDPDTGEAFYQPDLAREIDTEEEILADLLGITPTQARRVMVWNDQEKKKVATEVASEHQEAFGRVIAFLLQGKNLPVMVHALAFAAGLDQLNGKKSQAQIARELDVTRSLVSHYVTGFADILGVQVTKFRKSEASREKFRQAQLNRRDRAKRHNHAQEEKQ